ncbi:MAG TPA: oligoendopeptidase F [Clostridia bacterium]|nr:oligoendopeptidase F [Clostridia bacterium]
MDKKESGLLKREEIADKFKWKLEHIYETNALWERDYKRVKELLPQIAEYKGRLSQSAELLYHCLKLKFDLSRLLEKVYTYAHMRSHEDSTCSYYQELSDRADSLGVEASSAEAFVIPELLNIEEDTLRSWINLHEGLKSFEAFLNDIIRMRPHVLPAPEEELLAMAGELAQAPGNIFNMLNNADIKFPSIKDKNGNTVQLTKGRYARLIESDDRRVRKEAFDAFYGTYAKQKNTLAAALSANIKANIFNAKARQYPSAREAALYTDNIPLEVYDNLIKTVNDNVGLMHRYVSLRKKMLGLDELHMYDLYTPLVREKQTAISYEGAVETVKKALKGLGEDYGAALSKGFESGWIDVYENEGKRSGAYSWGCYDSHPYVLLNHNDSLNGTFTLAHEMGHALHTYYSNAGQPYVYAHYKIFTAEVASIVNEVLLMDYMLKNAEDKNQELYFLDHYIEKFRATLYRQTMFAEFEKLIYEKAEQGEALTCESLCKIYRALNVKYYGQDVVIDDYIDLEWARIPHFYTSFYVYKYATGFSAAVSLAGRIISEGQAAADRYIDFLKSGGSDYPIELLKKAGVDMTRVEPVCQALKVFEDVLDRMEALLEGN